MDAIFLSVLTLKCYTCADSTDTDCMKETNCQASELYCKTVENGVYSCVVCFHFDWIDFFNSRISIYWETKIKYISVRGSWISHFMRIFLFFRRSHHLSDMRTDVWWKSWHKLLQWRPLLRLRTLLSIPFQALFNQDTENKSLWFILSKFCDYHLSKSSYFLRWKHVEFEFHVFQIY